MSVFGIFIFWSAIQQTELATSLERYQVSTPRSCGNNGSSLCPSWSYCDRNSTCQCFDWNYIVLCSENGDRGGILQCQCLTFNNAINAIEGGSCIYNCNYYLRNYFSWNRAYTTLPSELTQLNPQMCGRFNRTGPLCSQCVEKTYVRAYTYSMVCAPCSGGWINTLSYILVAFIPLTLFYIIILIFSVNVPSSNLQGFVLISQIITSPMLQRVLDVNSTLSKDKTRILFKIFGTFFGMWNLDFFRVLDFDICFKRSPLTILSLDILIAVYPFLLILGTHMIILLHSRNFKPLTIICKIPLFLTAKLCRKNWNIKTSTVDAFVTFALLSYVKMFNVCLDLLVPVTVHNMKTDGTRYALFMDASLSYFGTDHLVYAIPAVLLCLLFIILPVLVLLLYPFSCFQKCLNIFPLRWQILVRAIVDSLLGRYKDGTDPGTRDFRWFSAIPFVLRFVYFGMISFGFNSAILPLLNQVIVLAVIITIVADPYKDIFKQLTVSFSLSMLCFAHVLMSMIGMDYSIVSGHVPYPFDFSLHIYIIVFIIILYTLIVVIKWVYKQQKFC